MIDTDAMPFLADIPRVQAGTRPDETAFWFEGETTTFRELDTYSNQVANGLIALGVEPDDRVGYLAKNTSQYYEMLFGAARARAVMTAVNTRLAAPEVTFILSDAAVKVLFVGRDFYDMAGKIRADLPEIVQIVAIDGGHPEWPDYKTWRDSQSAAPPALQPKAEDDVIQLYTSGTTGLPKGVNLGLLGSIQGARTVVMREIDPQEILRLIGDQEIHHAFWVPAVILMLTQQPNVRDIDWSRLKQVFYGASPIAESLLVEAQEIMGARFTQLYGLTETVGAATYLPPEAHDPAWGKLRSCGVPYPAAVVRCVDVEGNPVPAGEVGEIVIKAGFVMKGYWNRPEATEDAIQDGFFHTGDAGYFDEDGFLYIHDRLKDMIVSGAENVYPAEVENAIFGHPAVADVAVIGVPDERWGEAVKAIIVPKPGETPSPEDIIAWAKERIAAYKCPKTVDFTETLPRNPSGKILRKDLREPYWKDLDRRVG